MGLSCLHIIIAVVLVHEGWCQCFNGTSCSENIIPATTAKECCVGTDDGLSFLDGTNNCTTCVVHGFIKSAYYVMEKEKFNTHFQLNVKGETKFGSALVVSGTITAEASDTADPSDFEEVIPVNVGNSAAEINMFIPSDQITLEYNDTVILRFTSTIPDLITGLESEGEYIRSSVMVHIIDHDKLQISFEESDYSITEGSELSTRIRLLFSHKYNQHPFTIIVRPVSIDDVEKEGLGYFIDSGNASRATSGADFTSDNSTVEIPSYSEFFDLPEFFRVLDDNIDEMRQSFAIIVEIGPDVPDYPTNFSCFRTFVHGRTCHGRRGAAQIRINDNDGMLIGFTQRSQTVSEGALPAGHNFQWLTIDVVTSRTSEKLHIVLFHVLESSTTAIVGSNNTVNNEFLDAVFGNDDTKENYTLNPGEDSIPSLITAVRNDFRPEPLEYYTISMSTTDIVGVREHFMCNDEENATEYFCHHTIYIENDDEPYIIAFVETMYTVVEGEGPVEVCVNLTDPTFDILDDTISVNILNDESSIYIPSVGILATPDEPTFLGRYYMGDGTDYPQQTSTVNLIYNQQITNEIRIVCYNQTIYDDGRLEASEYVGLSLGIRQATAITNIYQGYNFAAIQIVDNDIAVVGLDRVFSEVLESVEVVQVCVVVMKPVITCPIEFPFNITFSTDYLNGDNNFVALTTILTFDTCVTEQCVNMSIIADSIDEPDVSFSYTITRVPGLDPRIILTPSAGKITILDDDEPFAVGFVETTYTVRENEGSVEICINLIRPTIDILDKSVIVYVIDSPSSIYIPPDGKLATPDRPNRIYLMIDGTDYAEQTFDVNVIDNEQITGKMRTVCYNQTIYDDQQLEVSEYAGLTLGIRQATVVTEVEPLYNFAAIKILDNEEMALVGLEKVVYSVSEDTDVAELCAVVTNPTTNCPIDFPFNVSLLTHDKSAVNHTDYSAPSVTLKFATCETRQCLNVSIMDDVVDEPEESFSYTLERLVNLDPRIILAPSAGEVFILDNDVQCFTDAECGGSKVPVASARECCVETDYGLSFGDDETCTTCLVHGFSKALYYVEEGRELEAVFQLFVKGETKTNPGLVIQGNISAVVNYAADNSDFEIQITSSENSTIQILFTATNDDLTLEDNDSVLLIFSAENTGTLYALQNDGYYLRDTAIVSIIDTDKLDINFEETFYSMEEGPTGRQIILQFTSNQNPFSLTLQTMDITTAESEGFTSLLDTHLINKAYSRATEGDDFSVTTFTIEVPVNSHKVDIPPFYNITDDDINEREQSFVLVAEIVPYSATNVSCFWTQVAKKECLGMISITEIRIVDNDRSSMDYKALSEILTFGVCEMRQCVNVSIVDDMIHEPEERFSYTLERTIDLDPLIAINPSAGEVVIVDDDDFRSTSTGRNSAAVDGIVAGVTILAVIVIVTAIVTVTFCVKKRRSKATTRPPDMHSVNLGSLLEQNSDKTIAETEQTRELHQSPAGTCLAHQLQSELSSKNMIILKRNLHLSKVVGQGESGLVYRGYLDNAVGRELVAIKTVKALSSPDNKVKLLKEVSVMLSFQHPNIMSLLGVCFDEEIPLLIMPFLSGGNVLGFVRHNKEMLCFVEEPDGDSQVQESRKTCMDMCRQICKGMSYLAKHKFVHRDLAARNCMIDQNGIIKVSDFGLTEDMYGTNYFRHNKGVSGCDEKVPIRWMAPESIEKNIYNEATDIWSFGVTIWEVFTGGSVPYAGVPALTLLRELSSGHRLARPSNDVCSDEIWSMMMSCWSQCPHDRPRFFSLDEKLSLLLDGCSSYLKLSREA